MLLIVKPEMGFTRVLAEVAATTDPSREFAVILDGPYGDSGTNRLRAFDRNILVAGGTGVTFIIPLLDDLTRAMKTGETKCKVVEVYWSVRRYGRFTPPTPEIFTYHSVDMVKLFENALLEAGKVAAATGGSITINVYVTADVYSQEESMDSASIEKDYKSPDTPDDPSSKLFGIPIINGRPSLSNLIIQGSQTWSDRIGVAGEGQ